MTVECLVSAGSNQGDRMATLQAAMQSLQTHPQITRLVSSDWCETVPAGGPGGQGAFLNGVVRLQTTLEPLALLHLLQRIENQQGRQRLERWGARTLDLDLLLYGEASLQTLELQVPHPRMAFRRFVLEPAAEVAPHLRHPTTGWSVQQLLQHLNESPRYAALAGGSAAQRRAIVLASVTGSDTRPLIAADAADAAKESQLSPGQELAAAWRRQVACLESALGDPPAASLRQSAEVAKEEDGGAVCWVSDFWIEQTWSESQHFLAEEAAAGPAMAKRAPMPPRSRLRPRLLVVVETNDPAETSRFARLNARLSLPDTGPMLRVPGDDPATAVRELSGALIAMQ
ncbi:2-amino-4-hydroxy-6-hydroxymethyldihydropteridine diphosphokinase [Lignipirellula cremea]|uniref:2-amino-4-hydroxy-6-hydroxymethyldihydropteridine pyrophosphokinase n=1 Tax=Lignipirellula cremea TaxID=2528010 RepID=A0A518DYG9_9BACT|nr:2-amino-4-hydroxy-6-hydroxymethyldihydropteridine diphosphokinase [Lignipirellula cremea]QDU96887.1 2-amino-4-hydroxy-6-hydroxymethyldihydropteridine pyrophosphokinase [Lignipirellula cremea]